MARKTQRARVDREKAGSYAAVADDFMKAASLAAEHGYLTAAGLLYVHGGIAFADAVAIHIREVKSTSANHMDAVQLLRDVVAGSKERELALGHLKHLIDEKSRVAYTGETLRRREVEALRKHAERFAAWSKDLLKS